MAIPNRALILTAASLALAACDTTTLRSTCVSDSSCAAGFKCVEGRCGCGSDSVCSSGMYCNVVGSCQTRVGCQTSLDCPMGEFCDTTSGTCIDEAHCTKDVQCQLGQVCDTTTFVCVSGCYDPGDCNWGQVCQLPNGAFIGEVDADGGEIDAGCSPTGGANACPLGECVTGPCADNSYCAYGQICVIDPTDSANNRCQYDTNGPFCAQCSIEPGEVSGYCCPDPPTPGCEANFCLVDTTAQSAQSYCGVDCSTDPNSCPFGFECDDVLVLTSSTCGTGFSNCPLEPGANCATIADCTMSGGGKCVIPSGATSGNCQCASDADCPAGTCDTASGQCKGQCVINEGSVQGFCTCIQDSECPTEVCQTNGYCGITGKACNPDVSNSCGQIFCKKVTDPLSGSITGYCMIGDNCAPENGVTCNQVGSN